MKPWEVEHCTLREVLIWADARLVERWDHTACLQATLYNLFLGVFRAFGSRGRARSFEEFHPLRQTPRRGLRIRAETIEVLRYLFEGLKSS